MAEPITVTFLGTGSAVPTVRRNHPSIHLEYGTERILVDCGEGTQRQLRRAKLNPCKITRLLITHWHADHVLGIPGLIQTLMLSGYTKELHIYGPRGTKQKMQAYLDLFVKKGEILQFAVHEIGEGLFLETEAYSMQAYSVDHDSPALGYTFIAKEKTRLDKKKLAKLKIPNSPLFGKLLEGKTVTIDGKKIDGKKMIYREPSRKIGIILDTRMCESLKHIAQDADVLISEATYSIEEEALAHEYGHLTSTQAASVAQKGKAKKLYLMHLSQRYEVSTKAIHREASKIFKNTHIPEDLDVVTL